MHPLAVPKCQFKPPTTTPEAFCFSLLNELCAFHHFRLGKQRISSSDVKSCRVSKPFLQSYRRVTERVRGKKGNKRTGEKKKEIKASGKIHLEELCRSTLAH